MPFTDIAIMGSGSWGTAMAKVVAQSGQRVTMWSRREEVAVAINRDRENAHYLPGVHLPDNVQATSDPLLALSNAGAVLLATPAQTVRENLTAWRDILPSGALICTLAKGLERGTKLRMTQVVEQTLGWPARHIGVLSGPNLAKEVAAGHPSAAVVASTDETAAREIQQLCASPVFRAYTNDDVVGVEISGVVKNIIALACGIAAGYGFGHNTLSVIITRGLAEITRLGVAMGAKSTTFSGLAGVGDLIATCTSPLSRNRAYGMHLAAKHQSLTTEHERPLGVVEGYLSCGAVRELAEDHHVEMPITEAVYRICHENLSVREAIEGLMGRKVRAE